MPKKQEEVSRSDKKVSWDLAAQKTQLSSDSSEDHQSNFDFREKMEQKNNLGYPSVEPPYRQFQKHKAPSLILQSPQIAALAGRRIMGLSPTKEKAVEDFVMKERMERKKKTIQRKSLRSRADRMDRITLDLGYYLNGLENDEIEKQEIKQAKTQLAEDNSRQSEEKLDASDRISLALGFIYDAKHKFEPRKNNEWQVKTYRSFAFQTVCTFIPLLHMFLSFYEPTTYTNVTEVKMYRLTTKFLVLTYLELFFIIFYFFELYIYLLDGVRPLLSLHTILFIFIPMTLLADWFAGVFITVPYIRCRFFRPIKLIISSRRVKRTLKSILYTLPRVIDVLILIFITLLLFGITGVHLFVNVYDGFQQNGEQMENTYNQHESPAYYDQTLLVNDSSTNRTVPLVLLRENFNNIGQAAMTLLTLLTTETWPNVGLVAFQHSQISIIFFMLYLFCMIICVTPVPVSVLYQAFRTFHTEEIRKIKIRETKCLMAAFICLGGSSEKSLPLEQVIKVLEGLLPKWDRIKAPWYAESLDKDGNGVIDEHEFLNLYEIICWTVRERELANDRWSKSREKFNEVFHFDAIIESSWFEALVISCVLWQTILLASYNGESNESIGGARHIMGLILLIFFNMEAIIKIMAMGFSDYWKSGWNKFDFILVIVSTLVDVLFVVISQTYILGAASSFRGIRILRVYKIGDTIKIIRIAKACRVMKLISSFASIFERIDIMLRSIVIAISGIRPVCLVMILIFYMWALLGVEMYSSDFQDANAPWFDHISNFGTFGATAVTLFQVFTTSNWHEILFNLSDAVSSRGSIHKSFAVFYVVSFYFVIVIWFTNLLIAMIWEFFVVFKNMENPIAVTNHTTSRTFTNSELQQPKSPNSHSMHWGDQSDMVKRFSLRKMEDEAFGVKSCEITAKAHEEAKIAAACLTSSQLETKQRTLQRQESSRWTSFSDLRPTYRGKITTPQASELFKIKKRRSQSSVDLHALEKKQTNLKKKQQLIKWKSMSNLHHRSRTASPLGRHRQFGRNRPASGSKSSVIFEMSVSKDANVQLSEESVTNGERTQLPEVLAQIQKANASTANLKQRSTRTRGWSRYSV